MSSTPSSTSSSDEPPARGSHHSQYRLRVTAGPSHDPSTHQLVPVNASETLTFENDHIILSLAVRIRHFTGYPNDSPTTSPYFDHSLHSSDQYSISFSFIPKVDIPGGDLIFGNDFDRPIRDRLPPGFNQAFKFVKWWIDPGLEGDVYADKPSLFGPALSSWNVLHIGDKVVEQDQLQAPNAWKIPNATSFHETVVEEGAEGSGEEVRKDTGIPADSAARKKYFLTPANRDKFVFEAGRLFQSDFGNPYLDFNDFSLKLPGFSLNVIKYVDAKTHELRYTLKNKSTDEIYASVMFTLLFGEELEQVKKEQGEANVDTDDGDDDDDFRDANENTSNHDDDDDDVD
ncbi:uncharacterized protein PV06_05961 [Exophiala oligosperma]|uniref:Domain of unknown function at the cortex 1 domain-containing protein n=2 Tax=Chaetothyriales TaxID=34395 RepID=A0A0D2AR38_9EURO|nr:uncharacterized protein PV06_05961 [Exophiala oligosperma]KAJ9628143.1 hypothetical protein H2204_009545 [Knufia peltigerae]KIW42406.1 hypothetical protein PV06_05961 [Exophiala oligosperma]